MEREGRAEEVGEGDGGVAAFGIRSLEQLS